MKNRNCLIKLFLLAVSLAAIGCIIGCSSQFAAPFDFNNLYFDYSFVSDSDGQYIVITKLLVSQTDVTIPDAIYDIPVKGIGESAFADNEEIASVTFGSNIKSIGANSFGGCTALESISFSVSASDIQIGEYAFTNCTALKSVEIPDHVTSVGRGAFYGCKALKDVTISKHLTDIGGRAFAETKWLKEKLKDEDFVTVGDGVLIAYGGSKTDVTLPKKVKRISGAFAGNTKIENVKLTSKVQSIGDMAFMGCESLETITIPNKVESVGNGAFYGCTKLKWVILKENVTSIGEDAFTYCGAAIYVNEGSVAQKYCIDHDLVYNIM